MGNLLTRGQKIVISKEDDAVLTRLTLELIYHNRDVEAWDIDVFAYMLEENNVVRKKNIVFYNQPVDDHNSFLFTETYQDQLSKSLDINLKKVPDTIHKIAIGISLYKNNEAIKDKLRIQLNCTQNQINSKVFQIEEQMDINEERSLIVGEFYRYKDSWKFGTILLKSNQSLLNSIRNFYNVNII